MSQIDLEEIYLTNMKKQVKEYHAQIQEQDRVFSQTKQNLQKMQAH